MVKVKQKDAIDGKIVFDTKKHYYSAALDIPIDKIGTIDSLELANKMAEVNDMCNKEVPMPYLVKYNGKVYGYYPIDQGKLDDAILLEKVPDKMNIMTALMYREVKRYPKNIKWDSICGLECKISKNLPLEFPTYKCKKLESFNKIDFSQFDGFPYAIIASAVNFTTVNGASLSYAIQTNSPRRMKQMEAVLAMLGTDLTGNQLRYHLQQLEKENPASSNSQAVRASLMSRLKLHVSFWRSDALRKSSLNLLDSLLKQAGTGDSSILSSIYSITDDIYSDRDQLDHTTILQTINLCRIVNHYHKNNYHGRF